MTTRQYAARFRASGWTQGCSGRITATHKTYLDQGRTGNLRAVQLLLGHTKIEGRSDISASK
jgi:hypothetical protein